MTKKQIAAVTSQDDVNPSSTRAWGKRVTTVFPRQGHYALDDEVVNAFPPADHTIERIEDLVNLDFRTLAENGSMLAGAAD